MKASNSTLTEEPYNGSGSLKSPTSSTVSFLGLSSLKLLFIQQLSKLVFCAEIPIIISSGFPKLPRRPHINHQTSLFLCLLSRNAPLQIEINGLDFRPLMQYQCQRGEHILNLKSATSWVYHLNWGLLKSLELLPLQNQSSSYYHYFILHTNVLVSTFNFLKRRQYSSNFKRNQFKINMPQLI